MADKFSKELRSEIMSKIRNKNTKPEILLRKALFQKGYRYSINRRFDNGTFKPDIVMVSRKICIFVDGCFWHKCPRCYREPKTNQDYWIPKLERNVKRDREQDAYLARNGWKVIRIWEHELDDDFEKAINKILDKL